MTLIAVIAKAAIQKRTWRASIMSTFPCLELSWTTPGTRGGVSSVGCSADLFYHGGGGQGVNRNRIHIISARNRITREKRRKEFSPQLKFQEGTTPCDPSHGVEMKS